MRERIFQDQDFHPGEVRWNELFYDEEKSLEENVDDLIDDQIWVQFINGANLHVDWYHAFDIDGNYYVTISHNEEHKDWKAVRRLECRTVQDLRKNVVDQVQFALSLPSLPKHVVDYGSSSLWNTRTDRLILDHLRPPQEQLEKLDEMLFDISYMDGHNLQVDWLPPHDPQGRFVITLRFDSRGGEARSDDFWANREWRSMPSVKVLETWECESILELRQILRETHQQFSEIA